MFETLLFFHVCGGERNSLVETNKRREKRKEEEGNPSLAPIFGAFLIDFLLAEFSWYRACNTWRSCETDATWRLIILFTISSPLVYYVFGVFNVLTRICITSSRVALTACSRYHRSVMNERILVSWLPKWKTCSVLFIHFFFLLFGVRLWPFWLPASLVGFEKVSHCCDKSVTPCCFVRILLAADKKKIFD